MRRVLTAVSAGGKGGVSVLENEVNIEGLSVNKNKCSIASFVNSEKKASHSNPHGLFSNCIQNDITLVRRS